jgi:hypothetical protein
MKIYLSHRLESSSDTTFKKFYKDLFNAHLKGYRDGVGLFIK